MYACAYTHVYTRENLSLLSVAVSAEGEPGRGGSEERFGVSGGADLIMTSSQTR